MNTQYGPNGQNIPYAVTGQSYLLDDNYDLLHLHVGSSVVIEYDTNKTITLSIGLAPDIISVVKLDDSNTLFLHPAYNVNGYDVTIDTVNYDPEGVSYEAVLTDQTMDFTTEVKFRIDGTIDVVKPGEIGYLYNFTLTTVPDVPRFIVHRVI